MTQSDASTLLAGLEVVFPEFSHKLTAAELDVILPRAEASRIMELEQKLGIPLPDSYKRFLQITRGFWLLGGGIQFGSNHPFFHHFPPLDKLNPAQRRMVERKGGNWPPPSEGMLCFAEYFRDADGDQVLFDVSRGLKGSEYPVMYYSHETCPPFVEKLADSFHEWLNNKCLDQMRG